MEASVEEHLKGARRPRFSNGFLRTTMICVHGRETPAPRSFYSCLRWPEKTGAQASLMLGMFESALTEARLVIVTSKLSFVIWTSRAQYGLRYDLGIHRNSRACSKYILCTYCPQPIPVSDSKLEDHSGFRLHIHPDVFWAPN